ncbi:phage/plasmid primase, P4 family [Sphingomonas sp. BK345]|uniref:phage/plasmid primase, P4 family n=1 Tax=Sphingomonas sp. BK345 TaxID=2586980 RepID=UPI00161C12A0|nr:phage/plasmid primase, P4 family [Sphingomonas sp. BK345]MBB3474261.1 P4 family phage/plasmid primase-like protein [Sphingomonas sp. BK345]
MTSVAELPDAWRTPVELGFSVFPVRHRDKRPALASWKAYQTARPPLEKVAEWARENRNIGIATGAISGLLVLDLDNADAIAIAEAQGLPKTIAVRTGKGRHVYLAHPGGKVGNRIGIFPGADIRGDGGYVVGPGSIHPNGSAYEWENPPGLFGLAPPPAWLAVMLRKPALIAREAEKVRRAPAGLRNDQLNKSAFRLGQEGADSSEARRTLTAAAAIAGLGADETSKTLASGLCAGRENPRRGDPSEDDIALAFTAQYRDTLRFDHDAGLWFEWDGTRWCPNNSRRAFAYARAIARQHGASGKSNFAAGVERFAGADQAHAVTSDVWDANPMLLGTPGGTVDLRTGEFFDARPCDYITKLAGCTPEHGGPTRWLRFLNEALAGDQEAIRFLRLWMGYCLTGETREHALIFLHGLAGTGKSVFLNTAAAILGDYAVTAAMETFTASKYDRHSTELAMLRGARLVTASETEEGRAWAEARIKQITGGDAITARFMRQDNFTFRPQFKLTIVGNHAPRLSNPDDAMRRRFNILGFNVKPATPDLQLESALKAEHGRILAWAIAGCREWQTTGLIRPAAVQDATAEYFAGEDLLGQWLDERCTLRAGAFELPVKLYNDWRKYAEEHGESPGTAIGFGKRMKKRGLGTNSANGVRAHRGVELRPIFGGVDHD